MVKMCFTLKLFRSVQRTKKRKTKEGVSLSSNILRQKIATHCSSIDNTHLLRKEKYNCTDDLQKGCFGFNQTSKTVVGYFKKAKQLNTNKINRRSAAQ